VTINYYIAKGLLDPLVGAAEERKRECDAKRLSGFEVQKALDFICQLDRQVSRLVTLENPLGIDRRPSDPAVSNHVILGVGGTHEAAQVHHASRRCCRNVAARCACAATGDASDRIPQEHVSQCFGRPRGGIATRPR
jgi:hypothetical protein